MPRRTFDTILSSVGVALTVLLVAAGALMFWGYGFANSEVKTQLQAQEIFFPEADNPQLQEPAIGPFISKYAGQQLTTGEQAKAYSDHYIAVHLEAVNDGKTYSQTSTESRANPEDAELAGKVQTLFRGETLRGLLLNAYAFWKMGQLALIGSIVAFGAAIAMAVLTILGFRHRGKASPEEQVFAPPMAVARPA